ANELFHDQLRRQGVTSRQFSLLMAIFSRAGQKQSELVERSGIDRSTLAEMLPRLVERGLVEKIPAPGDGRANAIKLSPAGRRLLRKCEAGAHAAEARMLAPMTEARRRNFLSSLALIAGTDPQEKPAKRAARKPQKIKSAPQIRKSSRPPGAA
ncbi:MAG: MarR family winged helix-turn-helix transcriptional regulator, partial [Alphaproteobacteria bacterium]